MTAVLAGDVPGLRAEEAGEPLLPSQMEDVPQVEEGPDGALMEVGPDGTLWDLLPEDEMPGFGFGEEKDSDLTKLALTVAASVVSLRAWDGTGREVASRCGVVIGEGGLILTEITLLQAGGGVMPEYVSGVTGDGKAFRVAGVVHADADSGMLVLRASLTAPVAGMLKPGALPAQAAVRVMALNPAKGLVLADAVARPDRSLAGAGTLEITGTDSAAAIGSPVFDGSGRVVAVVTHRVSLSRWMAYAQPVTAPDAASLAGRKTVPLAKWKPVYPGDPGKDPRFLEAFRLLGERKTAAGARALLKLTTRYPRSAAVWSLLGAAATALGAREDALACQRRAVSLDPAVSVYWRQLADAARRAEGKPGGADSMEANAQAAAEQPGDAAAWIGVAEGAIRGGDWARGAEAAQRAVQLAPAYARGFRLLGYCLQRGGRVKEAEVALREGLRLDGGDGQSAVLLAGILETRQATEEALVLLKRATQRDSGNAAVWLKYARLLKRAGRGGEADTAFQRYRAIEGERAGAVK
jgi:Flp pilus assembly protein TadD